MKAQILYYWAENLAARATEFTQRIVQVTYGTLEQAQAEFDASITTLFQAAAWADKYDGAVHNVPIRGVALAMNEAMGVIGMACSSSLTSFGFY